jgi:hypothetical protein
VAYGASKAALNSMTQSLAAALGPCNVAVSAVAPGFVETEMAAETLAGPRGAAIKAGSPFNRVATPNEVMLLRLTDLYCIFPVHQFFLLLYRWPAWCCFWLKKKVGGSAVVSSIATAQVTSTSAQPLFAVCDRKRT